MCLVRQRSGFLWKESDLLGHFCELSKTDQDTIRNAKGNNRIRWNFGNLLNFVNEFLKIIFLQKETCCVICVKFQVILRHHIWLLKLTKMPQGIGMLHKTIGEIFKTSKNTFSQWKWFLWIKPYLLNFCWTLCLFLFPFGMVPFKIEEKNNHSRNDFQMFMHPFCFQNPFW